MEIYLTYRRVPFSNIFYVVFSFKCTDWITCLLWYHDHPENEFFCSLFFWIYVVTLLASNLFHFVLFLLLNSHSFVTSECYLTSFLFPLFCFVLFSEFFFPSEINFIHSGVSFFPLSLCLIFSHFNGQSNAITLFAAQKFKSS